MNLTHNRKTNQTNLAYCNFSNKIMVIASLILVEIYALFYVRNSVRSSKSTVGKYCKNLHSWPHWQLTGYIAIDINIFER